MNTCQEPIPFTDAGKEESQGTSFSIKNQGPTELHLLFTPRTAQICDPGDWALVFDRRLLFRHMKQQ